MFFKKSKQVKCEECKHYVDREDAQGIWVVVKTIVFTLALMDSFYQEKTTKIFFCPLHRKPWDRENRATEPYVHEKFIPAHYEPIKETAKEKKK